MSERSPERPDQGDPLRGANSGDPGSDLLERLGGRKLPRRALLGLGAFLAISAAGLGACFLLDGASRAGFAWSALRAGPAVVLVVLVALDWTLGALRIRLLVREAAPRASLGACLRANLANMFMGAITPTQTGGGPALLYMLSREGVPLPAAFAQAAVNLGSTLIVLPLGAVAAGLAAPSGLPPALRAALFWSFVIFGAFLALLLALFALPRCGPDALAWLRRRGPRARRLSDAAREWREAVRDLARCRPRLLVASLIATAALYFNKCVIGYVVARALGIHAPFAGVLAAQAMLFLLCYFAPTPGASLLAEVSQSLLMGDLLEPGKVALFVALARTSTLWLAVAFGGWFLARQVRRDLREHLRRQAGRRSFVPRTGARRQSRGGPACESS